jgi:hypothetical protein
MMLIFRDATQLDMRYYTIGYESNMLNDRDWDKVDLTAFCNLLLQVSSALGDISIRGIDGCVEAEALRGNIHLQINKLVPQEDADGNRKSCIAHAPLGSIRVEINPEVGEIQYRLSGHKIFIAVI